MSTELATVEATPLSIIQTAIEKGVDPQQLAQLMDLQERYERNRAAEAFGEAMTRFQATCPMVFKRRQTKESGAFGYTFASYDDVMAQAGPALKECGLAISFSTDHVDAGIKVTCRIRHGIHCEDHTLTVPVPSMKVNDTQRYGAALSYAKRYALCAALNIVVSDDVDDDAASLNEVISEADCRALEQLLMDSNSNIPAFCKAYAITQLSELPASQLAQARAQINRKIAKAKGGQG